MLKEIVFARFGHGSLLEQYMSRKLLGATETEIGTDTEPYFYRASPSLGDYNAMHDEIVGASVGANQLYNVTTPITLTKPDSRTGTVAFELGTQITQDHKYLLAFDVTDCANLGSSDVVFVIYKREDDSNKTVKSVTISGDGKIEQIFNSAYTGVSIGGLNEGNIWTHIYIKTSASDGATITIKNLNLIDLTALLGSTIADYVYTLETNTSGSGVAWLKRHGFIGGYVAFNSGSIESVSGLVSHDTVGFNQWDEVWEKGSINVTTGANETGSSIRTKNYIPVLPNATYFAYIGGLTGNSFKTRWYDADKNYIGSSPSISYGSTFTVPSNAYYLRFCPQNAYGATYKNDICINIAWDNSRNGQYEPYIKHSYPLDNTVTLRGLFKLDANNNLYADGDTYESDGTITRYWGERAYQSGDESLTDAITDGTTTVYKLTTPTTETATPYAKTQKVDPSGTEEYVSTGVVPVGHNTEYIKK